MDALLRRRASDGRTAASVELEAVAHGLQQRAASQDDDGTVWVALVDAANSDWRARRRPRQWNAVLPPGCHGGLATIGPLEWRAVEAAVEDAYSEAMLAQTDAYVRGGALSWFGDAGSGEISAIGVDSEAVVRGFSLVDISEVGAPGDERAILAVVCGPNAAPPRTNVARFRAALASASASECTLVVMGPTFMDDGGSALREAAGDAAGLSNAARVVYTRVSRAGQRSVAVRGLAMDMRLRDGQEPPDVLPDATVLDERGRGPLGMRGVTYAVACTDQPVR